MAKKFFVVESLRRGTSARQLPKPKIVIVCEGKVTEPRYFSDFRRTHGNGLVIVESIGGCGVPISVVERAIEERDVLIQAAKRSGDSFDRQFEVWAVFDRDEHPSGQVPQAIALARRNDVNVAYSNPCFEIWGLMHYSCYARPGHQREAQEELKQTMPSYCHQRNPILDMVALRDRYQAALANAQRALELQSDSRAATPPPPCFCSRSVSDSTVAFSDLQPTPVGPRSRACAGGRCARRFVEEQLNL